MKTAVIIAAAGSSRRMGQDKLFISLCGKSVIRRSIEAFVPFADTLAVVCSENNINAVKRELDGIKCIFCLGGKERSDSVKNALEAVKDADIVLVHDGARPLIDGETVKKCILQTASLGSAVVGVKAKDTIKQCQGATVINTPNRADMWQVQTPQGFDFKKLCGAYQNCPDGVTDDAMVYESAGHTVYMLEGEYTNIKLTTPEDISAARAYLGGGKMRIGNGYDVHAFAPERRLVLCGVDIPSQMGLLGHSDADVAVHALMDALLGAAGLRDIGYYFPDTDLQYKGANSMLLLGKVMELINKEGYSVGNADITIMAQAPKISPYIDQMQNNIAQSLKVDINCVSVKATTTEKLGFVGRKEGIAAQAVVLLEG